MAKKMNDMELIADYLPRVSVCKDSESGRLSVMVVDSDSSLSSALLSQATAVSYTVTGLGENSYIYELWENLTSNDGHATKLATFDLGAIRKDGELASLTPGVVKELLSEHVSKSIAEGIMLARSGAPAVSLGSGAASGGFGRERPLTRPPAWKEYAFWVLAFPAAALLAAIGYGAMTSAKKQTPPSFASAPAGNGALDVEKELKTYQASVQQEMNAIGSSMKEYEQSFRQEITSKEALEAQVEMTKQTLRDMGLDPGDDADLGCFLD